MISELSISFPPEIGLCNAERVSALHLPRSRSESFGSETLAAGPESPQTQEMKTVHGCKPRRLAGHQARYQLI
jgi:hypothetical protein